MLSKKILLPVMAICALSMAFGLQSCETATKLVNGIDKDTRKQLLEGLILDGLTNLSAGSDSTRALAGIWVATDGKGTKDTIVMGADGSFQQHYISGDSLNYVEKGTYQYFKSFKQVRVATDQLYNHLAKKNVTWKAVYIYNVSKMDLSNLAGISTLVLEQLDNDPSSKTYGQSLGATQYSAVKTSATTAKSSSATTKPTTTAQSTTMARSTASAK